MNMQLSKTPIGLDGIPAYPATPPGENATQ